MTFYPKQFCCLLLLWALTGFALWGLYPAASLADASSGQLKIGVLAVRGEEQCRSAWSPTADYLSQWIDGYRFVIVPLTHDRVSPSVEQGQVDFILANSAFYVLLEHWYRISRIATLKERTRNGASPKYGGVVLCRSDGKIRTWKDLKGKTFMAVSERSLGGWLMARRELAESGLDPYKHFKSLLFNETHDEVVFAVRDRLVDAGTVRTGTLEALSTEGKIDLADFFVLPQRQPSDQPLPYLCSTREYPGWPMARVRHTSDELAEKVAVALLQMPPDSPAARTAGCAGWTIPSNYQPVHECLKTLKVGPYKDLGRITFADVVRNYGHWIVATTLLFIVLMVMTGAALKLNSRIKASNQRLKAEMALRRQKEGELQQAKEMAESATRAKSEFLANMSHEIRTPMNGVIAAADLALSEEVPPKIAHYLQIIHGSAYSLLGIINDILDFSKIEAGKFELKPRVFRLGDVIDRVMELFVDKAGEKGLELLVDIEPDTPKNIRGDPLRLAQILTNLISNAVKFTDAGGVIRMNVKEATGQPEVPDNEELALAISVKDTGTGIAREYLDQLFEPFTQADTSSTRKYEGTGLGLSICKQLVQMMNGQIGVESELGKGSTFFFTVRMRRATAGRPSQRAVPPDIRGLTVLVVDDQAESRDIMRKMLTSLGFKVETVASGAEALNRLKRQQTGETPIELVMMDWKMPGMDGIEVSRIIRKELQLPLPVIMMTAFGKEEQRMEAEAAGINGFLHKPIYPSTLFDAIMDAFGKEGVRATGRKRKFTTRASIYRKHLKGLRVLVAEDNLTNQQVARAILEGAGIMPTIVANGEEAVKAVQSVPFDAVLMDIQMPRMNGYEATRVIRRMPRGEALPIIAMTAHAMKGDEEKCLEAGMDGYIAKPVNQDRLFHTLWRLLRTSERLRDAGRLEDETPEADLPETNLIDEEIEGTRQVLPSALPGIRIGRTLQALSIDAATFKRILEGFRLDNQDIMDRLKESLAANDLELLHRLAHGLKGSAANIGADELSATAHALEAATDGAMAAAGGVPPHIHGLVDSLSTALNRVLSSLQLLSDTSPAQTQRPESDDIDLPMDELLPQLTEAIDRADPEQINIRLAAVRRQAQRCRQIDPAMLKTLEQQITRYDYDDALKTIQTMIGQCQETS